jgi:hypothetical protein
VSQRHLTRIAKEVKARGYEPKTKPSHVLMEYVIEAPRFGRPNAAVNEANERKCVEIASRDRNGREKSAEGIAIEVGISRQSVCRIMKKSGYRKVKSTTKPGLNEKQKEKRLAFARKYQHWTLEDWKNVIWSDETSVVMGQRRGSYRVWKKSEEGQVEETTRKRWKSYSKFMF